MTTWVRGIADNSINDHPETLNRPAAAERHDVKAFDGRSGHRILLIAASYTLPYRVLRCAKGTGAQVYVLGDLGAQTLRLSRFCDRFVRSNSIITGTCDEALALEINVLVRELGITVVLAGDAPSTRSLIACRNLLDAVVFPLPTLEQFDELNNKWCFSQTCRELGLPHPRARLFARISDLRTSLVENTLDYPMVLKPLSLSGNQGVIRLERHNWETHLRLLNYEPIVAQDFVCGRDMSVSIYCHRGQVQAFVLHERRRRVFSTSWNPTIYADMVRMAGSVGLDGVFNFDMIVTDAGEHYYLECNPRFFFSISLAMLAGLNFITLGLAGDCGKNLQTIPAGISVRAPEAVLSAPWSWPKLSRLDLKTAAFVVSDPLPMMMDQMSWPA